MFYHVYILLGYVIHSTFCSSKTFHLCILCVGGLGGIGMGLGPGGQPINSTRISGGGGMGSMGPGGE